MVPKTIETRLSMLSSTKQIFDEEKVLYQQALEASGYKDRLQYIEPKEKKKKRRRNITWFNPPYSRRVDTDIGRKFLEYLDLFFPKGHDLRQIMNRNCVKLSYSTTKNMQRHIAAHNAKVLSKEREEPEGRMCNCRKKDECPLQGRCLEEAVVYQADVITEKEEEEETQTYYGLTEGTFKDRYNSHQFDMRHQKNRHSTALSKYVHALKDKNIPYRIEWKINSKGYPFQCGERSCDLCLQEKLTILLADPEKTLNCRSEIVSKCRHKRKFSLLLYDKPP